MAEGSCPLRVFARCLPGCVCGQIVSSDGGIVPRGRDSVKAINPRRVRRNKSPAGYSAYPAAGKCGIPGHSKCDAKDHGICRNCMGRLCVGVHGVGICQHEHRWELRMGTTNDENTPDDMRYQPFPYLYCPICDGFTSVVSSMYPYDMPAGLDYYS